MKNNNSSHVQAKHSAKKKTVQQKGNHHFLGLALRRKNYGFQRKMSSKKKELIHFSGQTLCKKKYGIQETV